MVSPLACSAEWSLPFSMGGQNGRCLLLGMGRMVVASRKGMWQNGRCLLDWVYFIRMEYWPFVGRMVVAYCLGWAEWSLPLGREYGRMVVAFWTGCISLGWRPGHLSAEWSLPFAWDGQNGRCLSEGVWQNGRCLLDWVFFIRMASWPIDGRMVVAFMQS